MLFCIVIGNVFPYLTSYFLKNIIDTATNDPNTSMQGYTLPILLIGLSLLLSEISYRVGHILEVLIAPRLMRSATAQLFSWILEQPAEYFEHHTSGELNRRIDQITSAMVYAVESFPWQAGGLIMSTLTSLVLLTTLHPLLAGIFTVWLMIFLVTSYPLLVLQYSRAEALSDTQAQLSSGMVDTFANAHTVHVFGAHQYEYGMNRSQLTTVFHADTRSRRMGLYNALQQGLSGVVLGVSLSYGAVYLFTHHMIGLGSFAIIAAVVPVMYNVIWNFGSTCIFAMKTLGGLSNAISGLSEHGVLLFGGTIECESPNGAVTFEHVTFGYPGQEIEVLRDLSIHIPVGQRVGIVGRSGAGKSTLVKLLLRQYEPTHGAVFIDDQDIHDITTTSLRHNITFVPQDTSLFQRTLYENIVYARPEATPEEVYEAARRAHAHDFINEFPEEYETLVGERGVKLSGGQRQRIALARAMLKNTPILVLDEATSALDGQSEEIVQQGLMEIFTHKTVIAIAHRLSTLRAMDRIIVLDEGVVVEDGAPHELLAKEGGVFQSMWERQKNGFIDE